MLQEGIYYEPGTSPPHHFSIMFLRVSEGATAEEIGENLSGLWEIYQELKDGKVRGLPGITVPTGNLNVLIGYGPKAFALPNAKRVLPGGLSPQNRFLSAAPGGGNKILPNAGLSYESGLIKNPATEEIMVQFLGDTPLTVNRPMVETWKFLRKTVNPATNTPILQITAFFMGFHREDRRSWIDFHDGLSNPIKGAQRLSVIRIKQNNTSQADAWTRGGTYMTFMRLPIDLEVWSNVSDQGRELLVGRKKVSGCPIDRLSGDEPLPTDGCPLSNTSEVTEQGNEDFREPPDGVADILKKSHVQRANHHRPEFENPESLRIYRQGYEFAETTRAGVPQVGLNFVSFQDTPFRVIQILTRGDWLGGTNFGSEAANNINLIRVTAAGIYFVPALKPQTDVFPGSEIFL